jgi:hypothetical protein|tara:strand:+ start:602 stop:1654 length:1053 start_codon:yes stop_codon:yes gene_type:complete
MELEHLKDGNYIGGLTMPKEKSDHWKQKDEKPRSYLIKRSNSFRDLKKNNSKKKGYFEITISKDKRNPPSHKLKMHDIIYVAETSGGIYAKGKVVKTLSVDVFSTIEEVLDYSKQFKDDSYWLDKIRLFKDKLSSDSNYKLRCHQYYTNQKLLKRTIPYNGPLKEYDASIKRGLASIFFELKEKDVKYLNENPDYSLKQVKKLDPKIPGDLRLKIYSFFNQNYSIGHLIDVDHFVPKSVGGPGNIIENLVPIGLSLNRYKSDSIPRSFFEVALNNDFKTNFKVFEKQILKLLKNNEKFISKKDYPNSIDLARKMNAVVSEWKKMDEIKNFYFEVNKKFNPDYVELIYKVK